jgi:hypothetical protein
MGVIQQHWQQLRLQQKQMLLLVLRAADAAALRGVLLLQPRTCRTSDWSSTCSSAEECRKAAAGSSTCWLHKPQGEQCWPIASNLQALEVKLQVACCLQTATLVL